MDYVEWGNGPKKEIPTYVAELTPAQYEYYCFLSYMMMSGAIDADGFKVRWMSYLLGFGKADFYILKADLASEIEAQLSKLEAFITQGPDGDKRLDFNTPVNLLPEYKGYIGPGDWLEGLTFGEFTECMTILEQASGQEDYASIARILYHIPADTEVPELLLFHAPTILTAVWNAITSDPVEINGRMIDFRIIFKSSGGAENRADDKTGWTGITFEVASSGVFGTIKEVEATEMWTVLLYLYRCKFEYLEEQRRNNS